MKNRPRSKTRTTRQTLSVEAGAFRQAARGRAITNSRRTYLHEVFAKKEKTDVQMFKLLVTIHHSNECLQ
jgi:hypothetical protein